MEKHINNLITHKLTRLSYYSLQTFNSFNYDEYEDLYIHNNNEITGKKESRVYINTLHLDTPIYTPTATS